MRTSLITLFLSVSLGCSSQRSGDEGTSGVSAVRSPSGQEFPATPPTETDDAMASGKQANGEGQSAAAANQVNAKVLDEATRGELWFHALKTRPIFAKRLEKAERVETLEGVEEVPAGTFLCRGEAGDIWPQSAERLEAKYVATDEVTADGWRKYTPNPDNQGVMAAKFDHPFEVQAKWGLLKGKAGDYVVKNYEDRDNPNPNDVWIVDRALFEATYKRSNQ